MSCETSTIPNTLLTGNWEMMNELKMYFREPDSTDEKEKFTYIAYLTQVKTAD